MPAGQPIEAPLLLVTGVANPRRLRAVADAELHGHLDDDNLDAIVQTLSLGCRVPIAVVNIVTPNLQTYAAEIGVGAGCTVVPDELSFCAEVVESGRELIVSDARSHPVYAHNPAVERGIIGSYAGVPLCDDGFVLGAVSIFDHRRRTFSDDELGVLRAQTKLASSFLALRRSARTDTLTQLPNRALCLDSLRRTLSRLARNERGVAVVFIDVDEFKAVNDGFGHAVGDELLVRLAQSMSSVLRPTDTLARYGGDEFVAVCEDVADLAEADEIAERLAAAFTAVFPIDGLAGPVNVSIGVALATDAGVRPEDLIATADGAMYRVKHSKRPSLWKVAAQDHRRVISLTRDPAPVGTIPSSLG